ncbi:MAG: ATP-binding protein, partial [Proteobacteria bacterium]
MKKLSSLTIIPDELYVERGADAQLKQVIMNMGRPAYVLVARQMGKTNLLLHAKRSLHQAGDLFVYIDASNPVETPIEFFNGVVDAMLDTGVVNQDVCSAIYSDRQFTGSTAAHRAHERELRKILNSVTGKVVIFLDEVDALRSRQYSDQVFAYIRSVYFAARTNFPEFNRLSYVLSGVGEPSELIKNKDISPFNIGQKIYLDDFSSEEYERFCLATNLALSIEVRDRVFYWAEGNPRMTWDILSALEDSLLKKIELTARYVDKVIDDMYLKSFDLPPVDHIRNLVEKDGELQSALVSMHYGKSESIASHIANKLYLAGIAKPDLQNSKASFRNKIIADSLSATWLQEVEGKHASPISRAYSAFRQKKWADALILLEECFNTADHQSDQVRLAADIASCKFREGAYDSAISWVNDHLPKKHIAATAHYEMLYWLGMSYFVSGNTVMSFNSFSAASEESAEGVNPFFYECLVNCCAHYIKDWEQNAADIERVVD